MRLIVLFLLAAFQSYAGMSAQTIRWVHPGASISTAAANTNYLVTGDGSGLIKVWSLSNGVPTFRKTLSAHKLPVRELSISADGNTIVSTSDDTTTRVWNLAEGTAYVAAGGTRFPPFTHHSKPNLFATLDYGRDLTIRNLNTGATIVERQLDQSTPFALSPRTNEFVTFYGEVLRVYSISNWTYRELIFPTSARSYIERVAFSPDGSKIAAAAFIYSQLGSQLVNMWNLDTGASEIIGADGSNGLEFSPDGTILATQATDYKVSFRNVETKEIIRAVQLETRVPIVFLSTNSVLLGNGLYTLLSGELAEFIKPTGTKDSLRFSDDGALLASETALWNAHTGELLTTFKPASVTTSAISATSIQPKHRLNFPIRFGPTNTIIVRERFFDRNTGDEISQLPVGFPLDLAENWYYTSAQDSTNIAELRRYSDGSILGALNIPDHQGSWTVATSPSQNLIATTRTRDLPFDKHIRIWNSADGSLRQTLSNEVYIPYKLTFSSDETLLAAGSEINFGEVGVWDLQSGDLIFAPPNQYTPAIAFDFLHSSNFLLWGYDNLNVTDLHTGVTTMTITNEAHQVLTLAVSPDQQSIAIARQDGSLIMLETPRVDRLSISSQGAPAISFLTLPGKTYSIEASPDLKSWSPLTNFAGSGARFERLVPSASAVFYRLSASL